MAHLDTLISKKLTGMFLVFLYLKMIIIFTYLRYDCFRMFLIFLILLHSSAESFRKVHVRARKIHVRVHKETYTCLYTRTNVSVKSSRGKSRADFSLTSWGALRNARASEIFCNTRGAFLSTSRLKRDPIIACIIARDARMRHRHRRAISVSN